ncbi:putative Brain tumor protein [Hypsibius exemplaris]|uniref:Brain tumor protein n=1 Tax=Hypsibius exemplaris TaxID=2072580 RepID=A0A1W0X4C3_HYPEX|nr:putative Brain tumor protein [Hypsibius exemplaris]
MLHGHLPQHHPHHHPHPSSFHPSSRSSSRSSMSELSSGASHMGVWSNNNSHHRSSNNNNGGSSGRSTDGSTTWGEPAVVTQDRRRRGDQQQQRGLMMMGEPLMLQQQQNPIRQLQHGKMGGGSNSRSPSDLGFVEPEGGHLNPYAEYGLQVAITHRDASSSMMSMSSHHSRGYGSGGGQHYANGESSSSLGYGMSGSGGGGGYQQHGQRDRDFSRARHYGGSGGDHQQDRDRGNSMHVNPYRNSSFGGRVQHIGSSFGMAPLPQAMDRMMVPRKELEMLSRFGETGGAPGQLDSPHGFCLGPTGEIIVADTMNNRIQVFDQKGSLLFSWGTSGYRKGRLWQPRKVAYIETLDRVVVSDRGRDCSRLQIFSRHGDFYSQIRQIRQTLFVGLTVYRGLIVAIENQPASCVVMTQEGKVLYHFTLEKVMEEPSDVLVVNETFYICDFLGHCVCVFDCRGALIQRIGSEHPGIIFYPNGIDVAESGDVVVADTHGNRFHVSVWSPQGKLLADYELPHMKVSRCCGLFMTPEGNLITAATNNNIVLLTNLLRVPGSPPPVLPRTTRSLQWPLPSAFDEALESKPSSKASH